MASMSGDARRSSSSAWLRDAVNQFSCNSSELSSVHTTKPIEDLVPGDDVVVGVVAPLYTVLEHNNILSHHWIRISYHAE